MTKVQAESALIDAGYVFKSRAAGDYWVAPAGAPHVRAIVRETSPGAFRVALDARTEVVVAGSLGHLLGQLGLAAA